MPNGDECGHDERPIWEQVKSLQTELVRRADEITELSNRVRDLETDKEALLATISLLREGE